MEQSWDKYLLLLLAVLVIGGAGFFITQALGFGDRFLYDETSPVNDLPETDVATSGIARELLDTTVEWSLPKRGEGAAIKEVPTFVSILLVESEGELVDMSDPNSKPVRPPVSNAWLLEHRLDFLNAGVLRQDPDDDGFTNIEEWEDKTSPKDPDSRPPYADKLRLVGREEEIYKLKFAARPDSERFQVTRMGTPTWPERKNFYMKVGEISEDEQFRIDSFEEKEVERNGITMDASTLNITYLPKQTKHQLVKNVEEEVPTYFAVIEFLLEPGQTQRIKEGDAFNLTRDPDTRYRVTKVNEDSAEIAYQTGGAEEVTVEIKKK